MTVIADADCHGSRTAFMPVGKTADIASRGAPRNAVDADFATRTSRYGHGFDVRATYSGLPCQPFWTWVTGKDLRSFAPRRARETLLSEPQLWAQIAWSWSIIVATVAIGHIALHSGISAVPLVAVTAVCWVLVVNRTRGLLHTFHYTSHGSAIADFRRARWIATCFMSIPIMHLPWDNYRKIHADLHHSPRTFCTDEDPDQAFMTDHGFRPRMSEREFWLKLIFAPFAPARIAAHIVFRLRQNFIDADRKERLARIAFWSLFGVATILSGAADTIVLYYLVPLFLITQFSSWLQHTTEHLWYAERPDDVPWGVYYGALSWGRFLGRPYPLTARGLGGLATRLCWWSLVVAVDIPIRLFSFMQDLPSHDLHHRSAGVNFWSVARERAALEGRRSRYGPMTETWGLTESWLILRDHLCRDEHDPFGIYAWSRGLDGEPIAEIGR